MLLPVSEPDDSCESDFCRSVSILTPSLTAGRDLLAYLIIFSSVAWHQRLSISSLWRRILHSDTFSPLYEMLKYTSVERACPLSLMLSRSWYSYSRHDTDSSAHLHNLERSKRHHLSSILRFDLRSPLRYCFRKQHGLVFSLLRMRVVRGC